MKQQANKQCSKWVFQEGDKVILILQPYKKTSLKTQGHHKLAPKFYGPYHIIKCIVLVYYKVPLPYSYKIHLIFHVLCLKKVVGHNCKVQTILLELDEEGSIWIQPKFVLNIHEHHFPIQTIKEVSIKWKDTSPEDATWEPMTILQQFPRLQP
jgi:hypothetical protein